MPNPKQQTTGWDGFPKEPERDGWHWIAGNYGGADMQAMFWRAAYRDWQMVGKGYATEAAGMRGWRYVAPCVSPDERAKVGHRAMKAQVALANAQAALAEIADRADVDRGAAWAQKVAREALANG